MNSGIPIIAPNTIISRHVVEIRQLANKQTTPEQAAAILAAAAAQGRGSLIEATTVLHWPDATVDDKARAAALMQSAFAANTAPTPRPGALPEFPPLDIDDTVRAIECIGARQPVTPEVVARQVIAALDPRHDVSDAERETLWPPFVAVAAHLLSIMFDDVGGAPC